MRNTVKHQQQPSTDGELCGDLLRTEGSSSLKSTRASSTGETRGKPIKRRASKLQKNGAYTYARVPPPFISTNQRAEKTKQIDLALSLSYSLVVSKRHILNHTPLSLFSPEMVDLLWPSSSSASRALGGKNRIYKS